MTTSPDYFRNPQLNGEPFKFDGGPVGVLLSHGYTATPIEVRLLGEYLHQQGGYTVSGPRLPGHGTTLQDLHWTRWRHWVKHLEQALAELQAQCQTVWVGGESMGGLLALYLAAHHPEVSGVLLYAPAIQPRNPFSGVTPWLQFFRTALVKNRQKTAPTTVVDERWQGYTQDSIPAVAQMHYLSQQVWRALPHIKQPLFIAQGLQDQTLKPEGAQALFDRVGSSRKELVWFERATHCLLLDQDWEQAAAKTLAFMQQGETHV
jgi:carboxylesterase